MQPIASRPEESHLRSLAKHGRARVIIACITKLLQAHRAGTVRNPVVECRVRNTRFPQLLLEPLMTVQADLHGLGEVRAELDEQRSKVCVQQVGMVVVRQPGTARYPRI